MQHVIGKVRRPRRRVAAIGTAWARGGTMDPVRRALRGLPLQAKLKIGAPDDKYEREADRVADQVMASSWRPLGPSGSTAFVAPGIQRLCADCEDEAAAAMLPPEQLQRQPVEEEDEEIQAKGFGDHVQRQPEEEEEEVQAKRQDGQATALPNSLARRVTGLRGQGQALPAHLRSFFEPRFGADFSNVSLHTDAKAAGLARSLRARAFTRGADIVFADGQYAPDSRQGRHLLAHELTHVIQQRGRHPRSEPGPEASAAGPAVQRWERGAAPAPVASWRTVPDAQEARLQDAEDIVSGLLRSARCVNFFRDNCTNGADALRNAFDNVRIYHMPADDNTFGEQSGTSNNIAYNMRAFRLGRFFMASTLLHEMFHTCDPVFDARDELDAETAVETCRLHTPFLSSVSPTSGAVGTRVTIIGWGFGPTQGRADRVLLNGVNATVVSWTFQNDSSTHVVIEVPAGAGSGNLVVINNNVRSNPHHFTVT